MLHQQNFESNKKPKSAPSSPKLSVGMFSNQQFLISQLISTKIKARQQQNTFRTKSEFKAATPVSSPKSASFSHKFNYNSHSQLSNANSNSNLENIQQNLTKYDESGEVLGDISVRFNTYEDDVIYKVKNNLKLLNEQIQKRKSDQINQFLLLQWQQQLNKNCDKLIQAVSLQLHCSQNLYKSSSYHQSINQLQKQIDEEIKNRKLVQEQTAIIINSQEQQIKQYILKIQMLEQELNLKK